MNINVYSVINSILSNLAVMIKFPEAFSLAVSLVSLNEKFQPHITALQLRLFKLNCCCKRFVKTERLIFLKLWKPKMK